MTKQSVVRYSIRVKVLTYYYNNDTTTTIATITTTTIPPMHTHVLALSEWS